MKIFYNKKISKNNNIAAGFLATIALVYLVYGKYDGMENKFEYIYANYPIVDTKIPLFSQHPNIQSHKDRKHEEDYPHDHLYDRNLTLVNLTKFKFLIISDICNVPHVSLVTIIHSASQNTEARAIIRWS